MLIDTDAKRIKSPLYNLLIHLNKYDEDRLNNDKLVFLLKNLPTHFKKLVYSIGLIYRLQQDDDFLKKYDATKIVSCQQIEYFFYKVSTIWDISYEIADILIFPKNKKIDGGKVNKYDFLDNKFKHYADKLPALSIGWYKELTKIRNRIVHGGINIMPFYVNDENVSKRICFQAYNLEVNDLIKESHWYSNRYNNSINFADCFFTYYTHVLYSYLFDFFHFVVLELIDGQDIDMNNDLCLEDDLFSVFSRTHKSWLLSDINIVKEITNKMIVMERSEGHVVQNIDSKEWDHYVTQKCEEFPFLMMQNITEGDWKVAEDK